jgi:dipeptidase E
MKGKTAPIFLLAGGRAALERGPDPALASAVSLTGKTRPSVAYIGAASGDNAAFRLLISRFLRSAGAGEVLPVPLVGRRFDMTSCEKLIARADAVFISGGDVEEGMRVLEERGVTGLFRDAFLAGKPFFGVSAGSIMLAREWVRWKDPDDDASAEAFPCLGFAGTLCDTHGEDEGWEELRALLLLKEEGTVGYGIRSGAAVVVDSGSEVSVFTGTVDRFVKKGGVVSDPVPVRAAKG